MQFVGGEPWLAGMPASVKFEDLRRDPRFALHSGSAEPDAFSADAKLSGRAVPVTEEAERAAFAKDGRHRRRRAWTSSCSASSSSRWCSSR